jgi:hypothetical protein
MDSSNHTTVYDIAMTLNIFVNVYGMFASLIVTGYLTQIRSSLQMNLAV